MKNQNYCEQVVTILWQKLIEKHTQNDFMSTSFAVGASKKLSLHVYVAIL